MPQYPHTKHGSPSTSQALQDELYNNVVSKFSTNSEVQIIREKSAVAAELILDNSLDWVYIDGDHTYEGVKSDLNLYCRKLKIGGYLCGDDYTTGKWWMEHWGVIQAVDEFIIQQSKNFKVVIISRTQYILQKLSDLPN